MAKALIVGNWKAYVESLTGATELFSSLDRALPRGTRADVVLCPPAPFLASLAHSYRGKRIVFGAQDADAEGGRATGAMTAAMLASIGVRYVIVGHSERRDAGESDDVIAKKVHAVLDAGLTPILCVGERERDREGHYLTALADMLTASLARIEPAMLKKVVIAYEPVWAVGASVTPSAREIQETVIFIRKSLAARFDRTLALKVRILYGGDVNATNAAALAESGVAGFLVGRASVGPHEFAQIVKAVA